MHELIVYLGRTNVLGVDLGDDVSGSTFRSQIREGANRDSTLIASWEVSFLTTGVDGELLLTLDNSVTSDITAKHGYMDIERMSSGEPYSVFEHPIPVVFKDIVTA